MRAALWVWESDSELLKEEELCQFHRQTRHFCRVSAFSDDNKKHWRMPEPVECVIIPREHAIVQRKVHRAVKIDLSYLYLTNRTQMCLFYALSWRVWQSPTMALTQMRRTSQHKYPLALYAETSFSTQNIHWTANNMPQHHKSPMCLCSFYGVHVPAENLLTCRDEWPQRTWNKMKRTRGERVHWSGSLPTLQ